VSPKRFVRAAVFAVALGVWLAVVCASVFGQGLGMPAAPDPIRTPGAVNPAITRERACQTHWHRDSRHVTAKMRRTVLDAYGVARADAKRYELDHLVPRQLGGADVIGNLWPQPWDGPTGAHAKDKIENRLHRDVCAGRTTLAEAQDAFTSGRWIEMLTAPP
jgi:hypothetical protein